MAGPGVHLRDRRVDQPPTLAQHGVGAAQRKEAMHEAGELAVGVRPVDPGDRVVLAVRVVVALLGATELVAGQQHRHALGQDQHGEQATLAAPPLLEDDRIVGRALDPAVPRSGVVAAVAVALTVRLVVLAVVADQVREREPVVAGDEVDARERAAAVVPVEVGAPGEPERHLVRRDLAAPPEVAHGVSEPTVPLGPLRREVADLVAPFPHVPRLGDQLDLLHHRVLLDEVEEGRESVHVVELAREGGRQVEAEPVDVHLGDPVAEAVHDELQDVRVLHVEGVPGARVVDVAKAVGGIEAVVGGVVDPPEREGRPERPALGGVVVDHVEDDLDARGVQSLDHRLELVDLVADAARIPGVRREEADRVVPPVVAEARLDEVAVVEELVHRQQLERGHAEPVEVLDDRRVGQPEERPS